MFSSRCFTEDVPGIGSMTFERCRSHARESCAMVASCFFAAWSRWAARFYQVAAGDWKPWDEREVVFFAILEGLFGFPLGDVVFVLHADDLYRLAGVLDFFGRDFGQPDMQDFSGLLQVGERSERFLGGNLGVDPVELVKIDAVEFQPPEAHFHALAEILRPAHGQPFVRSLAGEAAFGGDDEPFGIRVQRLCDEPLAHLGAVGIGGVDKIDPEFDGLLQDAPRFGGIFRLAPDAFARQAHRAKAQAVDGKVATQGESAACGSIEMGFVHIRSLFGNGWVVARKKWRLYIVRCRRLYRVGNFFRGFTGRALLSNQMNSPIGTVAIVGRPNVGKSALFNRFAGRRISIVHDQPGVTRDRLSAPCALGKKPFMVFDTGGIGSVVDAGFSEQVRAEADIAIETSEVILLVVDGRAGLSAVDEDLAKHLRRVRKPLILVVNKVDHDKHSDFEADFSRLGFDSVVSVSAEHDRGIGELVERIEAALPETPDAVPAEAPPEPLKIAIVGRPNVGKSSLVNAILEDRRTMVSPIAGTTRDAVDIPYERAGEPFILIDTAGIRPRGKREDSVEIFSVMRAESSIRRAALCVLVIDATAGVTAQDKKIGGLIRDEEKPCIVIVNKSDLLEAESEVAAVLKSIRDELFFLDYAPIILLSAKTGKDVHRLFRGIRNVRESASVKIGTGVLNRLFQTALESNPPPLRGGKRFRLLYGTQIDMNPRERISPPAFLLFVNDPDLLPQTYRKYLEGRIREKASFDGLPILFRFRGR